MYLAQQDTWNKTLYDIGFYFKDFRHLMADDGTLEVGLFMYDIPKPQRRSTISELARDSVGQLKNLFSKSKKDNNPYRPIQILEGKKLHTTFKIYYKNNVIVTI